MCNLKLIHLVVFLFLSASGIGQTTQIKYLSGTGADHTVDWDFFCSAGMNSGEWTKIAVPSCWEQQGFGSYNYGHDKFEDRLNETGLYRHSFNVPADWKGKIVTIVFDGVMTDALVKVNGKQAGPVHQGAFYRFKHDITHLIRHGKENHLEVLVKKHSDDESVSLAERQADFWIFGGIFRPVYLEAKPVEHIRRVAIDAQANGRFVADVYLSPVKNAVKVNVEIKSLTGTTEAAFEKPVSDGTTRVSGDLPNPLTWSPESPNLYNAVFWLLDKDGNIIHQATERFGFRTIEVRESDGVYVNGVRIKLKGVCRHTFHPDYGRTSSKALSIEDVNLMKDMNMNAVRMSHYPPETHFLDVCDSLGLFVLDELTAWQKPSYDDVVGRKLLEEMIERDVNHPSIIFWDNGNEGGENDNLNDDFAELDIQKREVLHPWADYLKTNTLHYIEYSYLSHDGYSKRKIFFPTEFLHGLYDGGHGAGLDDYWRKMWDDPLCAGGFLWVFADEAIRRTDRNGEFDTDGNHAPDGIVGPYHEKEGSFYSIKEIWAPVLFEKRYITKEFDGSFRIENRYFYTDLERCKFMAEWVTFSQPDEQKSESVLSSQDFSVHLSPGQKGQLKIDLPHDWQSADALRITAHDPSGRLINTWIWPVKTPEVKAKELLIESAISKPDIRETESTLEVIVNDLEFSFNKTNGTINKIVKGGKTIPLSNGPVFVSRKKDVQNITHSLKENSLLLQITFDNGDHFTWTVGGDGRLHLDVAYTPKSYSPFAGITFDFPEAKVSGMQWLGDGPYRVYKNRMKGTPFGLWNKKYNNTVTGESGFQYPEFKGYHSEIYWVKILGNDSPDFKVFVHSKDIFLRMLTPQEPKSPGHEKIEYPAGDLSFLHGINAIGSKFLEAEYSGPESTVNQFFPSKFFGKRLSLKLTFDFSTSNNPDHIQEAAQITLSAVSSMVKVPMELEKPLRSTKDTARISAAGGEYESFQVVVSSDNNAAVKGVRWRISALRGETGEIGIVNITLNPVGYVETTIVPKVYPGSLGWWPDPLLRMDSLSIPAGERQPLWVTVYVPRGTPAGTYKGHITVNTDNAGGSTIPVSLRVWGFDIPLKSSIKTLTWVGSLEKSGGNSRENRKAYYKMLLKHRLGPGGQIELDEDMLDFCIERGMNAFILDNIPNLKRKKQDSYTGEYKDSLRTRLKGYVDRFGSRGWLDGMAYVYNYDEVDKNHWPLAKEMYSFVKNVSQDLNVIQCLNIPEGVEALAGYADTWDVYVQQYEKSGVKKRVEAGDEAWLAVCCWPSSRPNFFHEYPAVDGRLLGWICFQTGVTGFEYWSPNHWKGNSSPPVLRGGWKANTFNDYNGDGYLTYPGPDNLPLASLRLANLRDGFEDYEYLYLLKKLGDNSDSIQQVVNGPLDFTSDPELLYQVRKEVAKELEKLIQQK